jgi:hypothetical protein
MNVPDTFQLAESRQNLRAGPHSRKTEAGSLYLTATQFTHSLVRLPRGALVPKLRA